MSVTNTILNGAKSVNSAISSVSNLANAAGSYANKIKSIAGIGKSPATIRDLLTNGFLAQDSIFSPEFFARAFDEPTYLTFRIEFVIDSNDPMTYRNISFNNNGVLNDNGEIITTSGTTGQTQAIYGTMYDYMPEPFLDPYVVTSNDASLGKRYSSESYLDMNLGDHARASMLHTFKLALNDIQKVFPFYFKSISGLSSLSKVDPKRGSRLKDAKITIECEEGLDLKITQLLTLYRKIVWDDTYQRWILPDMMRYFGMRIYVSEIRTFHDTVKNGSLSSTLRDFSQSAVRNATYTGGEEKNGLSKTLTKLNQATSLTNAFLGTKSIISRAVNTASQALGAVQDIKNTLNSIATDVEKCNHAINTVMPTLCYECHMCEFDIEDSMGHVDQLHSSTANNSSPTPKIVIKVGNVQEKHSFPLNATLNAVQKSNGTKTFTGYSVLPKEINSVSKYKDYDKYSSFMNVVSARNIDSSEGNMFLGNYAYDEALNKRYTTDKLGRRIEQYTDNLGHIVGDAEGNVINVRRYGNEKIIQNLYDMSYDRDSLSQENAVASLTAAALNEASDVSRKIGVTSSLVGTNSTATDQINSIKDGVEAVGDALQEAVERIYTNPSITSLATSESNKVKLANFTLNELLNELDESTATQNTALKAILKSYKELLDDGTTNLSTATSKSKIEGFSGLN